MGNIQHKEDEPPPLNRDCNFIDRAYISGQALERVQELNRGGEMAEQIPGAEKKVVAGVLAILTGCLGIHKFYLGYTKAGLIMLLVTLLTCFAAGGVMAIIGIIEGIVYLTKTDAEFVATYVTGKKEWF
jgi:TM2 domain-containing membrane protein YozV